MSHISRAERIALICSLCAKVDADLAKRIPPSPQPLHFSGGVTLSALDVIRGRVIAGELLN